MVSAPSKVAGRIFSGFSESPVLVLGATTTIGYGTLYYAYGVVAPVISKEFGVGLDAFFLAFTAGLLLGGLFAPLIGRQIDKTGAHSILAIGSVLAGAALVFCSLAQNIWMFFLGVLFMELAACFVLYEAAFAGLTQVYGQGARSRITAITLIAGFASTIFWPLTQTLVSEFDWRLTFIFFAVLHVAVCLPLHWRFLGGAKPLPDAETGANEGEKPEPVHLGPARKRALVLYTLAICGSGFIMASFPIHMITILQNENFTAQVAALVAMAIGPSQVLARFMEVVFESRFNALMTGRAALLGLVVSIGLLLLAANSLPLAILFALIYGASQGLITIIRGTVPLLLFGARGYGALNGRITGIRFLVNAAGPFFFAFLATRGGVDTALFACWLLALASFLLFLGLKAPQSSKGD